MTVPKIYVASIAHYNAGILHGVHIDLEEHTTVEAVEEQIENMLETGPAIDGPAEDWRIDDSEGLGDHCPGSLEGCIELAEAIAEHGDLAVAVYEHLNSESCLLRWIEDNHMGSYKNLADFAFDHAEQCEPIPSHVHPYIDWQAWGEDLATDYISIEADDGNIHLFANG